MWRGWEGFWADGEGGRWCRVGVGSVLGAGLQSADQKLVGGRSGRRRWFWGGCGDVLASSTFGERLERESYFVGAALAAMEQELQYHQRASENSSTIFAQHGVALVFPWFSLRAFYVFPRRRLHRGQGRARGASLALESFSATRRRENVPTTTPEPPSTPTAPASELLINRLQLGQPDLNPHPPDTNGHPPRPPENLPTPATPA